MPQRRQRLADFEARSVQLVAACTLGLAGLASVPPAHAARVTGQTTSLTGTSGNTTSPGSQPGQPPHPRVAARRESPQLSSRPQTTAPGVRGLN